MNYISKTVDCLESVYKSLSIRGKELAIAASIPMLVACSSVPDVPTQEYFNKFRETVFRMKTKGEDKLLLSGAGGPFGSEEWGNGFRIDQYTLDDKTLVHECRYKGDDWDKSTYDFDADGDGKTEGTVILLRDFFGPGKHLIGVPASEEWRTGKE